MDNDTYGNHFDLKAFEYQQISYFVVWLVFFLWSMRLIDKSDMPFNQRVEHTLFAFLFAPAYVVCWYVTYYNN